MTDLNLTLWGAGGAVIFGVVIYNFWQEYRAKKNVERAFGSNQDDVLMKPGSASDPTSAPLKREPVLDEQAPAHPASIHAGNTHQSVSPDLEQNVFSAPAPVEMDLPVDDFIDCIIPMEFDSPIRGDKILSEIQSFRRIGNKPVHFIGINEDGKREMITHGVMYSQVIAGAQLVSRSGPLNELEYSELVTRVKQIADNLNAYPDIPDMKHVMDAGRDLHIFVTEHDAQLSVNVQSKGAPWAIATLLAALEKQGFDVRPDGRLAMLDGEGGALYTLSTNAGITEQTTSRITLLLDVPCVAPARGGFKAMISCAKNLALRLGGAVVDDSNSELDDATIDQIYEQVELFYSAMQAADIPAGSSRAVRIFS